MDPEISKGVVIAFASIGAVAWLAGLSVLLRATRERRARAHESVDRFDVSRESAEGTIVGEAEVDGTSEELSVKLAKLLARDGLGPLGPVKIVSCDRRELVFEMLGPISGPSVARRGWFRLAPAAGKRTRIEYALETSSGRVLLALGWSILFLGLAALIAGVWLEFTYVVPSPDPNIRTQAVQMVQVVHLLWPPFLFAHVSRQPARMLRTQVESLVNNLPYA
jgi:hypothetical protein